MSSVSTAPPALVRVTRKRRPVSALTCGAVNSTRFGSLAASSVTPGPSICVQVCVSPGPSAGQARSEALPPSRTAWSEYEVTLPAPFAAVTVVVTVALCAVPLASLKSTRKL